MLYTILFDYLSSYITLTDDDKVKLKEIIVLENYKKGSIVLDIDERSLDSYFVVKGCLRSYYVKDGEERTTEFFTEKDIIAPTCVVDGSPSTYAISCIEDSILLISNPAIEETGMEQFPVFEGLCRLMSEKQFAKKQVEFDFFKISNPEERYDHVLKHRAELFQRVPQYQLASYLGITPQSLSRLRRRILVK